MVLPNFLCVGAQKAGTSWFDKMIRQHPDVWMPPLKELHYFNHLYVPSDRRWTKSAIQIGVQRRIQSHVAETPRRTRVNYDYLNYLIDIASRDLFTESWYNRIFDRPKAKTKVRGEVTPAYGIIPQDGISYFHNLLPKARIVYIIRDPVDRTLSQLRMVVNRRRKPPNNVEQWRKWAADPDIENRSDYAQFIPLWRSAFPRDQLLFIPYGDIGSDPSALLRRIETFLGLNPSAEYKGLHSRVFETAPVVIPNHVAKFVSRRMEQQREFLRSEFGEDFAARCRGSAKTAALDGDNAQASSTAVSQAPEMRLS